MPKTNSSPNNPIDRKFFAFLKDLKSNNNREWFMVNKPRYEEACLAPALQLITMLQAPMRKLAPSFLVVPKAHGGSMMRIYRDTRFSKDKTPYKTNIAIHFRHEESSDDVHAPGFYIHLEPGGSLLGVGAWQPGPPTLSAIRESISSDAKAWQKARDNKSFKSTFDLSGDVLKRPPRDYPANHPMIEDLKRKDFAGLQKLTDQQVLADDFPARLTESFHASKSFMQFLCNAIDLEM